MKLRDMSHAGKRRDFLERETGTSLASTGSFVVDESVAGKRNCEHMIGATQVPLGVAGPLLIRTASNKQPTTGYFIPLATTEGALVASVHRGCKAISASGGVHVSVVRVGVTRGSVYKNSNFARLPASTKRKRGEPARQEFRISNWLHDHFSLLQDVAEKTSRHITLLKYDVREAGPYLFIRWYFDTADAMGMNMATIASDALSAYIEEQVSIRCVSVAGNFDVDKKPSWLNTINGRGRNVSAYVVIPRDVVSSVLKTTPDRFEEVWKVKCMIGSSLSGSMGQNAHIANVVSAMFIATGQDPAHVVEASQGMTIVEKTETGDLYCAVSIPCLMIGTVGGGTGLSTQAEALQMLGCYGDGKSDEFAGVVAGAVLAGEISLLASLAEGSLAKAHGRLKQKS